MQNLALQIAKAAPTKQAANQNNMANLGADSAVNSAPNAFAELLKKQVKQQKTEASEAADSAKPAGNTATAPNKAADTDSAAADGVVLSESTLIPKAELDEKTEENLPPIQDLILMQMGLQPASQLNTQQANAVATDPAASGELALGERAGASAKNALPWTGVEAKSAQVTDTALHESADSSKQAPELTADDQAVPLKGDQAINQTLVRDKEFKEIEMKSVPVQIAAAAPVSNKLSDNMVASVAAASEIPTPFGRPEWSQAVNQKVVWMVGAGDQSATLTLNPPDLGPLQVVIQVENDQVDTTFISDNPEVRQALQDGMNMLRDKMQDSGMQLGNAQVSSQAQSQRHFEQAMQQRAQQRLEQSTQVTNTAEETVSSGVVVQRVSNGLVDTFA
ncbi:flagellar hook-length control protein [Methylophilaceae bacterium 11]|jgi:flagellar hook-length control protein FliK|nr:flagellar hook-length control protein [Methylophilaceae bacterium 11]